MLHSLNHARTACAKIFNLWNEREQSWRSRNGCKDQRPWSRCGCSQRSDLRSTVALRALIVDQRSTANIAHAPYGARLPTFSIVLSSDRKVLAKNESFQAEAGQVSFGYRSKLFVVRTRCVYRRSERREFWRV